MNQIRTRWMARRIGYQRDRGSHFHNLPPILSQSFAGLDIRCFSARLLPYLPVGSQRHLWRSLCLESCNGSGAGLGIDLPLPMGCMVKEVLARPRAVEDRPMSILLILLHIFPIQLCPGGVWNDVGEAKARGAWKAQLLILREDPSDKLLQLQLTIPTGIGRREELVERGILEVGIQLLPGWSRSKLPRWI